MNLNVKRGPFGGLFLVLDAGKENGVRIENKVRNKISEPSKLVWEKKKPTYDNAKNTETDDLVKIYVQTIQPSIFFPNDTRTKYMLTSIKLMTGTKNFLALPNEK